MVRRSSVTAWRPPLVRRMISFSENSAVPDTLSAGGTGRSQWISAPWASAVPDRAVTRTASGRPTGASPSIRQSPLRISPAVMLPVIQSRSPPWPMPGGQ